MNGRIYDGQLGRFLSADLVIQFPDQVQSFNRYSYVQNNPLSRTDKTGFQETVITPEEAEKRKNSAAKINELVQNAINKAFDRLEKGKIKPDQVAGEVHATLTKNSGEYGNDIGLAKKIQGQGKDYVTGESTKGTKYEGGLPVRDGAKKEAHERGGAVGAALFEAFALHENKKGELVWDDDVVIAHGINIDGSAIGTDKLDHMFESGFKLFEAGFSEEGARTQSEADERGISGFDSTGVYSNADIEANMNGFSFYSQLNEAAKSGTRPTFNISTYNVRGMDENVNPNVYTSDVQEIVDRNTKK